MANMKRKENPISFRMPAEDISIIDRAAAMEGRSRTEFVRHAAVREAEAVLLQRSVIKMSPAAFRHFMQTLEAPAQVVPALVKVMKRKAPWEK